MVHFPLFVDLHHQPVLVVGGGPVAFRKVKKLLPYGPRITVTAPEICPELTDIPGVAFRPRRFRLGDLRPRPALVLAATDDPAQNRRIAALCRRRHIPVNVADDPAHCTFLFPALVRQGNFSAGISTGGASPTAAAFYKNELQSLLPDNLEGILTWLEDQRPLVKARVPADRRSAVFHRMFERSAEKGRPLTPKEVETCLDENKFSTGRVDLVGAGCGKADLITLRGLRLLQRCQAVVYDDLIDPDLLESAPESAQRIYVGKRAGKHAMAQEKINQLLIDLANQGLQVVRLKGGDPYLFGRGGEEMLALKAAGIDCREVPGIPSALGIPAEAGIPVTHRGVSRGVHIVTAHTSDTPDGLPEDMDTLAQLSGTLVFLMGLGQLPKIVARLLAAGKPGDTPAAVLSGGNAPHPARVRAKLADLAEAVQAAGVESPAIILVGEAAALDVE